MTKQLYLEAIEALRQRVEAMGEGEELRVLDMLAEEIVKALARFNVAERAESATDTATPGSQAEPPPAEGAVTEPLPGWETMVTDTSNLPAEVARFLAAESVEYPIETPPPLVIDAWAWRSAGLLDDDDLIALEDDDLFTGGDWDLEEDEEWDEVDALIEANNAGMGLVAEDEEDSDLWEDDPDFAREYIGDDDGEDDESGL